MLSSLNVFNIYTLAVINRQTIEYDFDFWY